MDEIARRCLIKQIKQKINQKPGWLNNHLIRLIVDDMIIGVMRSRWNDTQVD